MNLNERATKYFHIIEQQGLQTKALQDEVKHLTTMLKLLKKELLMRAEKDSEGVLAVNISSSVWYELNKTLKEQQDNE